MISIIIPTYNAEKSILELLKDIKKQTIKNYEIIIIDSSSTDKTIEIARQFEVKVIIIPKTEFNHGLTRTLAGKKAKGNIVVYLTQDIIIDDTDAIKNLISFLKKDKNLSAVYGRQLPKKNANPLSAHLRYFNYPNKSYITDLKDKKIKGMRKIFFSNSFSAYKKKALKSIGWFNKAEISEDMDIIARLLLKGYKIGYCAEAKVFHSHNFSIKEEFERSMKQGRFCKNNQFVKKFGKAEIEGIKYFISGTKYLIKKEKILLIPGFILINLTKYISYLSERC